MTLRGLVVVFSYNEHDFIAHTIRHLLSQGLDIQVFDNWSTDPTFEILQGFRNDIKYERWPDMHQQCSSLTSRLYYLQHLALETDYDWVINHDADEIRRSPVPGESLIDFIIRMDAAGYNAIDHTAEVYRPREGWDSSQDPETFFTERLEKHTDHRNPHIKAWKAGCRVELVSKGGHQAIFPGRRVAPEKLILKHYPFRSQAHAERKIRERRRSYTDEELAQGWHSQYRAKKWWT